MNVSLIQTGMSMKPNAPLSASTPSKPPHSEDEEDAFTDIPVDTPTSVIDVWSTLGEDSWESSTQDSPWAMKEEYDDIDEEITPMMSTIKSVKAATGADKLSSNAPKKVDNMIRIHPTRDSSPGMFTNGDVVVVVPMQPLDWDWTAFFNDTGRNVPVNHAYKLMQKQKQSGNEEEAEEEEEEEKEEERTLQNEERQTPTHKVSSEAERDDVCILDLAVFSAVDPEATPLDEEEEALLAKMAEREIKVKHTVEKLEAQLARKEKEISDCIEWREEMLSRMQKEHQERVNQGLAMLNTNSIRRMEARRKKMKNKDITSLCKAPATFMKFSCCWTETQEEGDLYITELLA